MKRLILLIIVGAGVYWSSVQLEAYSRKLDRQLFGEVFSSVNVGNKKLIALTLDDGPWGKQHANNSLHQLNRLDIKATYFLNGSGIKANMPIVKRMVSEGHQIGNHAYNHKRMYFMLPSTLDHEVGSTSNLIREAGYTGEILFRAPYGRKLFTLPYYLEKHNIVSATWSIAPEWPASANAEELAQKIVDQARPGAIILLHPLNNSNQLSRDAIDIFVPQLKAMGYRFVTLNELQKYSIDSR